MAKKPFIFYCDDKPKWTDRFKERHGGTFDIKTTNKSEESAKELAGLVKAGLVPDIILIDLYNPRAGQNADERKRLEQEGQAAIDRLSGAIKEEKVHVLNAWEPIGYSLLEQARKLCPRTPIAIYTEMGLTLADNSELDKVSEAGGEWIMKGTQGLYEDDRLRSMLNAGLYAKTTRNILWTVAAAVIAAAAVYMITAEQKINPAVSLAAILMSLVLVSAPGVISHIARKKMKKYR